MERTIGIGLLGAGTVGGTLVRRLVGESEAIVAKTGLDDRPLRIIDVGTGTGCLLVTLLAELPLATGLGIDLAPRALVAAQANAARHGVAERADFAISDALEEVSGRFDILVSNPPYIRSDDIAGLDDEVRLHPLPSADIVSGHEARGFRLVEHVSDYAGSRFDPEVFSANIFVFTR